MVCVQLVKGVLCAGTTHTSCYPPQEDDGATWVEQGLALVRSSPDQLPVC